MRVVIVGSGLAGATVAFPLKFKGHDVEVFETRNTIGVNNLFLEFACALRYH